MSAKFTQGMLCEETILERLEILPGQTVLDAGCGNGYMTKHFAKLVGNSGSVYALDSDRRQIERLRGEISAKNVTLLVGDITQRTELAQGSVDLIYLSTVYHVFSPAQVAGFDKEVHRLLRPGGRLAVVNINKEETDFGPPLAMRSSPAELCARLSLRPTTLMQAGEHFYLQLFERPGQGTPVHKM